MQCAMFDDGRSVEPEHDASGGAIDGVPGATFIETRGNASNAMRAMALAAASAFGPRSRPGATAVTHGAPAMPR